MGETMATPTTTMARLSAILAGSIGNLVEWFDWYTYSAAALYFAPVFFPKGDQTAQLLQAAAVFAVGFFARPVGAWLLGRYADRVGRKAALKVSVIVMCVGTLAIAATPGAEQIGIAAPIILLIARVVQGLALGGEYGTSATYMSEVAGRAYRGFWSSFNYVTLIGGQLVALAVLIALQHALSAEAMESWGWRVPFVIGAVLAVVAYVIRSRMVESPSFTQAASTDVPRGSTRAVFLAYPRETLTILGLTAGGSLAFYIYTTYMQKFLSNTSGFSRDVATEISAISLCIFCALQPFLGWVSDKVGRKPVLFMAFGGGALITWPLMHAIAEAHVVSAAVMLICAGMFLQAGYTSVSAVVKAELFPTAIRSLGVAFPYAIANAIFGGTAEYVALWFKAEGMESGFYIYASAVLAVAFVAVVMMPETRRESRILED